MKRSKKDTIIIISLGIVIIILSVCLVIAILSKEGKKDKKQYKEITEIVCGKNQDDLSLALCYRYFDSGYIILLKDYNEDMNLDQIIDSLSTNNISAILIRETELKELIKKYNKEGENDFGFEPVIYIPNYNVDYDKLTDIVSKNDSLDRVINYSGLNY